MILIAFALLCLLSVPLTGGRLGRLASIRLRATWVPVVALAIQVLITTVIPDGHEGLHKAVHIATYVLIGVFLWSNRRLPGVKVIGLGAFLNALVITVNDGQMAASRTAERLAGLHLGGGFENSAPLTHPHLLWFGDIIPWPGPLPNVLSIGDCLIYAGTLILLHRVCRRSEDGPVLLTPAAEASVTPQQQPSQ
ncbi:MAG TPA: DUF5317 domain-containing protein [Solirubrobacteraceae bacterium]|nr:DUF5317 domain-containing protein [Solirubrobacteraceae bacterium]